MKKLSKIEVSQSSLCLKFCFHFKFQDKNTWQIAQASFEQIEALTVFPIWKTAFLATTY